MQLDAAPGQNVGGDRLAQRGDAVGRRVAVVVVGERLAAGLDDVRGRREVGLADAEIDDVAALGGQRVGARQHLEGAFGAEARHAGGGRHRSAPPRHCR